MAIARDLSSEDNEQLFAMADKMLVESKSTEAVMTALAAQRKWTGDNWEEDTLDWRAARLLGASRSASEETNAALRDEKAGPTSAELTAVEARVKATQEILRAEHGDIITLYRGVQFEQADILKNVELGEDVDLGVHGLSSWSTSLKTAKTYADQSRNGVVLKSEIKIDDVFMSAKYGPTPKYKVDKTEVVIMSKTATRKAELVWAK
jgi:hypothetical protein